MIGLFKKIRFLNIKQDVKDSHGEVVVADRQPTDFSVQDVQHQKPQGKLSLLLITSVGVTALIAGIRYLQWLQPLELAAYDYLIRSRTATTPDNRLLLVTVTEDDIQREGYPLPDATVNKLLVKLESYQPRVIGLNIYRPQQKNLGDGVKNPSNIFGVCGFSSLNDPEIPPPPNFTIENIGFNDLAPDRDRIIRRSLLFADSDDKKCHFKYSFASLLALEYLQKQNIESNFINEKWVLGQTVIPNLQKNSGSYVNADADGYQIMLDYRHPNSLAQAVSVTDILNNKVNPNLIKDKLVIIGSTATSMDRGVSTPYSALAHQPFGTAPIFIHAQTVSQILSTVLDGKRQIWYWQDWQEIGWIWLWAILGGVLAWRVRNPLFLLLVGTTSLGGLLGICYLIFLQAGWIPLAPPAMALLMTGVGVMAYSTYRTQIETRIIILQVEKQQEAIAQLSALLKENTHIGDNTSLPTNAVIDTPQRQTGDFLLSGRYEISRVLGSGGFGCTYLAKDRQRPGNPTCVVKQLMPARRDARFLQVARRLFDAEAEILLILGKHPQIPDLLAFFTENQEFYLVQEYVKGKTLHQELSSANAVKDELYVIEMLKSILQVLKFVHEHRVIHRDIKPENIIRNSQDNKLVLIDFGAVKTMQPPNTEKTELATVAIGTRGYAAPEQLVGHPRLSSDVYALGMIAIQALTGIAPHALAINQDTGNVEWRNFAKVSDALAAIIDQMVCYHFSDRYQSAAEVLEDLKRIDLPI
ncbi:CHASE2 domain-containing serine/threonine-protein kinase [Calothrix sp. UHCC 0171]|uniref:CHASE2 domain-containing serine/threonine-protein kinase n=1 Tax=Calothrix sp. UHCC 0171 TaxID=3110245 RepID=UPI002B1F6516|nr:CHASE2 domain-containing serine/threonine-protein kinase [Calothrix sp. UHCC 0171]MEA5569733.1 CHASE2 domain-containing serine/threonine-protein kinase [Calothrix sp. UHCC 0171]